MALKVAINGFGRIGRCVARIIAERDDVEITAINDLAPAEELAYLMRYDTVHGRFNGTVEVDGDSLVINGKRIRLFSEKDPTALRFAATGAEVMLECTGLFLEKSQVQCHIDNGIKKVLFSAPAKDDTPMFVLGVNDDKYAGETIISNASCTTNCLAPMVKILDDAFGIENGLMTTIHSYTNDQSILDIIHKKERRRGRAGAANIVPTTTGAAKAIGKVLPHLKGKLDGHSVRIPTPDVSMTDLVVNVRKSTTAEEINALFTSASEGHFKGIVKIDNDQCVSMDFRTDPASAVFVADMTKVVDGKCIKIMAWYDNEWGYSTRLVDMAVRISK
jgi:glyceraldehyde 3-phosphate dehydrogenase